MFFSTILFYLFSILACISGILLIGSRNAIHSVLFLVLVFFNVAGLLLLLEAEFLALLFLVVYVGAIAVLFLFVVMMLNIRASESSASLYQLMPIGSFLGFVFLIETFLIFQNTIIFPIEIENNALTSFITFYSSNSFIDWITSFQYSFSSNIKVLGFVLYTDYVLFFLLAGAILLIALLGAIILTMQSQENVVRQEIYQQLSRNAKHAVFVADINNK